MKNRLFKSAIGGYKKSTVNEYIENENRRFAEIEASYKETIESLRRMLDGADAEIKRLEEIAAKLDTANEKITALEAENLSHKEKIAVLSKETETLKNELADKDIATAALTEENEKLRLSLAEAVEENEKIKADAEEKAKEQTETKRMGNPAADAILGRAKAASEDMLKRAEEGAEVILSKARLEAIEYKNEIFAAAKEVFDTATDELRRSVGICMDDFISGIKYAKGDTDRARRTTENCEDDLSRRIERMMSELDRAIAEKLAGFTDNRK